jgi:small subunit ribosomal protein S3
MLKDFFINQGIKEAQVDEFIRSEFPLGDYSKTEIQRTPLGIKIIIYTNKPGRIIGKGGKNINDMTEAIKNRFGLDNPQLDVKVIRRPNLDPRIVAKQITSALEKGYNYKKIGNLTMKRIMDSGAIGAQITISGKMGGGKGISAKFQEGYLKHCGEPAKTLVDVGFEEALVKLGKIGVRVKIMKHFQDITGQVRDTVEHRIDIGTKEPEEKAEHSGSHEKKTAEPKSGETAKEPAKPKAPEKAKPSGKSGEKPSGAGDKPKPGKEKPSTDAAEKGKPGHEPTAAGK